MPEVPVSFVSQSGKVSEGTLLISEISLIRRVMRSGLRALLLLFCGVVGLIVPLLHLVLPLVFLILAVLVAKRTLQIKAFIERGTGSCPECHAPFRVFARRYSLPFTDLCESCHREITIGA